MISTLSFQIFLSHFTIKSNLLALAFKIQHRLAQPLFLITPAIIPQQEHHSQTTGTTSCLIHTFLNTTHFSWWALSEKQSLSSLSYSNVFLIKTPAGFLGWPIAVWVLILVLPLTSCTMLDKLRNFQCLWFIVCKMGTIITHGVIMKITWVSLCRDLRKCLAHTIQSFAISIIIII